MTATTPRIIAIAAQIVTLRIDAETAWTGAVDGAEAEGDADRVARAEAARDEASDAWDRVTVALDEGDLSAARGALESARTLAAEWGDDTPEREALDLLQVADYDDEDAQGYAARVERELTRLGLDAEVEDLVEATDLAGAPVVLVTSDDWPDPIQYRAEEALALLREQEDGAMRTGTGDARVCAALEAAGAYIRTGAPDPGEWGAQD